MMGRPKGIKPSEAKQMAKGRVKWFNGSKGFGFISQEQGPDVFVHISALPKGVTSLSEGQEVTFEVTQGDRGPKAVNVRLAGQPPATSSSVKTGQDKSYTPANNHAANIKEASPYNFCKRPDVRPDKSRLKQKPERLHDKLNDNCYDIAFEITWTTSTPTAANPCTEPGIRENGVEEIKDGYKGYNKRWLMFNDENNNELQYLAISPFTVKSAIANGFASLMGSCYRVNAKTEGHSEFDQGQYPYNGGYKRYRVSMNNKSFPGILVADPMRSGDHYVVKINPVFEYYYDNELLPFTLKPGNPAYAFIEERNHKFFVKDKTLSNTITITKDSPTQMIYWGQYCFGMENSLEGGQLGKGHYHRFFSYQLDDKGEPILKTAYPYNDS